MSRWLVLSKAIRSLLLLCSKSVSLNSGKLPVQLIANGNNIQADTSVLCEKLR
jgi:hypothetical protein